MPNNKSIQVLRGSGSDKTEVLLDGQPYFDKTANKLYIGDGVTAISNLKPLQADSPAPYVVNLTTGNWSGSTGNYTYSIAAATHGKGAYPQVRTFVANEECYDSPTIDTSGNITLKTNAKVAMRVVVY